jgi:hypothetical protein
MRLVLAMLVAGAVAAHQPTAALSGPEVTRSVRITREDETPTRTYSAPAMAVDPEDENTVVAAFAEMRTGRCGLVRSTDRGRTWRRVGESPALPSYPLCFTPSASNVHHAQVAFGRNHVLYVAMAGWDAQDGLRTSVLVARSEDLGETWSRTLVRDVRGLPEPEAENTRPVASLAVDRRPSGDVLYVGWTQRFPNARPPKPGVPVVAVSSDGGRTFSGGVSVIGEHFEDEANWRRLAQDQPTGVLPGSVRTPPDAMHGDLFGGFNPQVVVGSGGAVFAIWTHQTIGLTPPVPNSLFISRSDDGGKSYAVVNHVVRPSGAFGNPAVAWTPAGGGAGTIHLVYEDKTPLVQGDRDIVYQRSSDGGRSWSPRKVLNDDDPRALVSQFLPNIVATPDGRVDVAWWDFRHDTGAFFNDAYMVSSPDNGATWSGNIRVTDRSIDRKIGPWSNGYDVRQPPGLAATGRYTVVAWDDTRDGDPDGQAQDLYRAFVQFAALPSPTSPALVYLFAGVVGLVLAGLVVTAATFVHGRRARGRLEADTGATPETAGVT